MSAPNPPKRTNYFSGQLLTAGDLARDQQYFCERLRRHNRALHGWGVVCGLSIEVVPDRGTTASATIIVSAGYALSPQGDEISVGEPVSRPVALAAKRWIVAVRCEERLVDPVAAPEVVDPGSEPVEFRAVEETYAVEVFEGGLPASDDRWVVLGEVDCDERGHVVIDTSSRQHAKECR